MKYEWLLLSIAAGAVGVTVARALGLSQLPAVTIISVPMFLASFPFMKYWMPKATFVYWVTVAAISTGLAWLLYFGVTRLGG
jgi:hypothetical protein